MKQGLFSDIQISAEKNLGKQHLFKLLFRRKTQAL